MNPVKTLQLEGDLFQGQFTKALCPEYLDSTVGNWQICVADVSLKFKNNYPVDDVYHISTNFVTGYDFNSNGATIKIRPTIQKFYIDNSKSQVLRVFQTKNWFVVNAPNDLLKLYVKSWQPSKLKKDQCLIQFTVFLSRLN